MQSLIESTPGVYLDPPFSKHLGFRAVLEEPPPGFRGFVEEDSDVLESIADSDIWKEVTELLNKGGWPKTEDPVYKYVTVASWLQDASGTMQDLSFGRLLQIVRICTHQNNILGHRKGLLVPYGESGEWERLANARTGQPTAVKPNGTYVETWDELKDSLRLLLSDSQDGELEVSKLKVKFRKSLQKELSETVFGHCTLSKLLSDPQLGNDFAVILSSKARFRLTYRDPFATPPCILHLAPMVFGGAVRANAPPGLELPSPDAAAAFAPAAVSTAACAVAAASAAVSPAVAAVAPAAAVFTPAAASAAAAVYAPAAAAAPKLDVGSVPASRSKSVVTGIPAPKIQVRPPETTALPDAATPSASSAARPLRHSTKIPPCKMGCGQRVAPGVAKNGRPFDTCCRGCATGKGHDKLCGCIDPSKVGVGMCKLGCGRIVATGRVSPGQLLNTCCEGCARGEGHNDFCGQEVGEAAVPYSAIGKDPFFYARHSAEH
ncbi:unnamed protein product [Polarella glacialis]|uniref:Uncharacterized protein n=1 Tax=Polarella glacialis TaxID=89957 RepID=A0A813GKR6_POLGL|nr:unnamed protein product [Polarella glacialis]